MKSVSSSSWEKVIDLKRVVLIAGVDGAEDVVVYFVVAEMTPTADNLFEAARAALVDTIAVVQFFGPIDAKPDEKIVRLKKRSPVIINERPVGLNGIDDALTRAGRYFFAYSTERWKNSRPIMVLFATLPGDVDFRDPMALDQLADVGFQQVVGHVKATAGIEHLLAQKEAILAVKIADSARWLGKQVEGGRRIFGKSQHSHSRSPVMTQGNVAIATDILRYVIVAQSVPSHRTAH